MEHKQIRTVKFATNDNKIHLICDSDTPLGEIHDFLLAIKGQIVNSMVKAQKDHEEEAAAQKEVDKKEEEPETKE